MKRAAGRPLKELRGLRETREPGLHEQLRAAPDEPERRKPGRPRSSLLTVDELASHLKIGRTSLYALMGDGLPYLQVGHVRRFDLPRVLRWLEERSQAE